MGIMRNEQLAKTGAAIKSKLRKQLKLHKQINIIKYKFTAQQRLLEEDQL